MVLQPQVMQLGAQASSLGTDIVDAGRQTATKHLMNVKCESIECAGSKALLLATGIPDNPPQASTMQVSFSLKLAPVPRPRPAWAG